LPVPPRAQAEVEELVIPMTRKRRLIVALALAILLINMSTFIERDRIFPTGRDGMTIWIKFPFSRFRHFDTDWSVPSEVPGRIKVIGRNNAFIPASHSPSSVEYSQIIVDGRVRTLTTYTKKRDVGSGEDVVYSLADNFQRISHIACSVDHDIQQCSGAIEIGFNSLLTVQYKVLLFGEAGRFDVVKQMNLLEALRKNYRPNYMVLGIP